jgi:hypothetical protein
MRKEFSELKKRKQTDYDIYVNLYRRIWNKSRKHQHLYDKETRHGLDLESNEQWILKIIRELNSLKYFELK